MDKATRFGGIICIVIVFICTSTGAIGYFVGRAYSRDSQRAAEYTARERELLSRIGEFEQREEERSRREAARIAAERERIARTQAAIDSLRRADRRASTLLQELEQEVAILAEYFRDSCSSINNQYHSKDGGL